MKEYFYLDESPIHQGWYCLRINNEEDWNVAGHGNFNILPARILGLGYDHYLEYCRDTLGARLLGRKCQIPYCLFKDNQATRDFVKFLNKRTEITLNGEI